MSPLDRAVVAERAAAIHRHLERVAARLPAHAGDLAPATDASDAVILHLWQATQMVIDMATAACVQLGLGSPQSYADAFRLLEQGRVIEPQLATRLVKAAGFRNVVAHAYQSPDMRRVHSTAVNGPADLKAFLSALAKAIA